MNSGSTPRNRTINHTSLMDDYKAKLVTPQQAVGFVRSDDTLFAGGGVNIPKAFCNALGARASELKNVTILQGFAMGLYDHMKPEAKESFIIETMFVGPVERICMEWGVGTYKPHSFSDLGNVALKAGPRVVAFSATPPDKDGYVNKSCFGSFLLKKSAWKRPR